MGKKEQLFCFPYSGGSASIYLKWFKSLSHQVELCPIELSGRSKRFSEPLTTSLQSSALDLYHTVSKMIQEPYALFGHSLGCLLIYELLPMLMENRFPCPKHIFLSGGVPPHFKGKTTSFHKLPDKELLRELAKMGGVTQEFMANKELQDLFLPIIRSDYKMFEEYTPIPDKQLFPCNITVLAGEEDSVASPSTARNWSQYAPKGFQLETYKGGHFFIKDNEHEISNLIKETLLF